MIINNRDLTSLFNTLMKVYHQNAKNSLIGFRLYKVTKAVQNHYTILMEFRSKLESEFLEYDEKGNLCIGPEGIPKVKQQHSLQEYVTQLEGILREENNIPELDNLKLKIEDMDCYSLSPEDFAALDIFIEE